MTSDLNRRLNRTLALMLGLALIEAPLSSQQNSGLHLSRGKRIGAGERERQRQARKYYREP